MEEDLESLVQSVSILLLNEIQRNFSWLSHLLSGLANKMLYLLIFKALRQEFLSVKIFLESVAGGNNAIGGRALALYR